MAEAGADSTGGVWTEGDPAAPGAASATATTGPTGRGGTKEEAFQAPASGPRQRTRQPFRAVRARPVDANGNFIAGWGRRFGAFVFDWGVIVGIELVVLLVYGFAGVGRIGSILDTVIAASYFTFTIGSPHGQTPGMRLAGICVIDEEKGEPPSYPKALLRYFLISVFMGMILPIVVMALFALYDKKRQFVHDKAVGTVVIELSLLPAASQTTQSPAQQSPSQPTTNGTATPRSPRTRQILDPVLAGLRRNGARLAITAVVLILVATAITVATRAIVSANANAHSPAVAATAYLTALSRNDVAAIQASAGIIEPAGIAPGVNVLLSANDIKRELAGKANSIGTVSDIVVQSSKTTAAGTATVTLSYHADNQVHYASYSLITSDHSPSGWVVQVTPARLDIDVPTGETNVTFDGIPLHLDGQVAHVYLFPSVATISIPATSLWQAASTTVDATNQTPNSDPQEVGFPAQLLPSASASAIQAGVNQINACLAATVLAPANCPNTDTPATTDQGDTYSGISWTGIGTPTAGFTVNVASSGNVTVSGAFNATVTYTDTSSASSFFGSVANQDTDGPYSWTFTYPLTWSGMGWELGTVNAQTANSSSST